jgi:hypothetical protein
MAKQKRLVIQHLENISYRVLEEYREVIKEIIKNKAGVYALYRRNKLYYVGLASNLMGRLKAHLKDRHHGSWEKFSVYLTVRDDHMKELESLLLRIVNPSGNRQIGKFANSDNLRSTLNQKMKEKDADQRALLIGGPVARRRRRSKIKSGAGIKSLAGIVDSRISLKNIRGSGTRQLFEKMVLSVIMEMFTNLQQEQLGRSLAVLAMVGVFGVIGIKRENGFR